MVRDASSMLLPSGKTAELIVDTTLSATHIEETEVGRIILFTVPAPPTPSGAHY